MNICSPCSGILHSLNIFVFVNWLVESLNQLSFFLDGVCTLSNFTLSPGLFTVSDPKDTISVVHVNKMLATVS